MAVAVVSDPATLQEVSLVELGANKRDKHCCKELCLSLAFVKSIADEAAQHVVLYHFIRAKALLDHFLGDAIVS